MIRFQQAHIDRSTTPSSFWRWFHAQRLSVFVFWLASLFASLTPSLPLAAKDGELTISPIDDASKQPVPIRVLLRNDAGRIPRLQGLLKRGDWYLLDRTFVIRQRDGDFNYIASRGLEYALTQGGFTMSRDASDEMTLYVERSCEMRKEDWWGGDLWSEIPRDELVRWMGADDLDLALTITRPEPTVTSDPSNSTPAAKPKPKPSAANLDRIEDSRERWASQASFADLRVESGLLFHGWTRMETVNLKTLTELPISPRILQRALDDNATHIAVAQPWARDVPLWLAQGRIDSFAVMAHHLQPEKSLPISAATYNPDTVRFSGPRGLGRLVEFTYWQLLEAGFRIAPSAASGFGHHGVDSHLGYNRIYVSLAGSDSESTWWERLKAGKAMVTNGPLLRPLINGELPGATLRASQGETLELNVGVSLSVRDPVEYMEVVHNGQSLYRARLDEHAQRGGVIPPLKVTESGWVLIRVVTDHEPSYRFAMTAPYYIEIGQQPRIKSEAVAFFEAWLAESEKRIEKLEPAERDAYRPYLEKAHEFWQQRASQAR
jgi:hypothetical protein